MSREAALEAYRALPVPDTTEEHWRFTDLRGFDPDAYVSDGHVPVPGTRTGPGESMVDLDVAGVAFVSEAGIEIERPPAGVTFEPLSDHPRLGALVGATEKFAAHNAALWEHGLLVVVPQGVELEQPLYVRVAGATFWRLLVVAEPRARFDAWLARARRPAAQPTSDEARRGRSIFFGSACGDCHRIAGTPADGRVGPDLTHVGSRLSLAAGTIPNTPGDLAGWILDPQHVKPGNKMPATRLGGDDLGALLTYLGSLK
jgi:cytochrome c2